MENDINCKALDLDVLKTLLEILGKHGKTDDEIKEMLEFHFQISSTTMDTVISARNSKYQKLS